MSDSIDLVKKLIRDGKLEGPVMERALRSMQAHIELAQGMKDENMDMVKSAMITLLTDATAVLIGTMESMGPIPEFVWNKMCAAQDAGKQKFPEKDAEEMSKTMLGMNKAAM